MGFMGRRGKSKSPKKQRVVSNDYNAMPSSIAASSSRSPGRNSNGNAASTAGYQYAMRDYKNSTDHANANANSNFKDGSQPRQGIRPIPTASSFLSPTATPLARNIQGTDVPAASLINSSSTNIRSSSNNDDSGNYNANANTNTNAASSERHDNLNTIQGASLNYSESQSPKKSDNASYQQQQQQREHSNLFQAHEHKVNSSSTMDDYLQSSSEDNFLSSPISPASSSYSFPQYPGSPATFLHQRKHNSSHSSAYQYEPEMVDTTYSEHYGNAYTGNSIRYIYPQGYGSMRPRSRPWQIALIMFTVLAWLNVFIVGHCADRFDSQNYNDDKYQNVNDDDAIVIETRWCGSRNLYFTWVLSVALTGLSFAYCSIIGYVKARDFAVANGRSQPPGMMGRTDYYVQEEFSGNNMDVRFGGNGDEEIEGTGGVNSYQHGTAGTKVKQTIYQADGTPRFFGGQIFKPTQAAVSLTSR
jgi:hypothetical protein